MMSGPSSAMGPANSPPWASSCSASGTLLLFQSLQLHTSSFQHSCLSSLSTGVAESIPCQLPDTHMHSLDCREIQAHVAEPFWYIYAMYRAPEGQSCTLHWQRDRLYDHVIATILYETCVDAPLATVTKVSSSALMLAAQLNPRSCYQACNACFCMHVSCICMHVKFAFKT